MKFLHPLFLCILFLIGCVKKDFCSDKNNIVSLSPNTSEIIKFFFPQVNLVGRTKSCDYPEFVKKIKVVCNIKPDIELLYALQPKKIFLEQELFQERELSELKKIAPLFLFQSKDLQSYLYSLKTIDTELGESILLKQYIQKLKKPICLKSYKKFIFLLDGGPKSNYFIAGKQSFLADILKISGYECIGPDGNNFKPIDFETLIKYSFDGIITGNKSIFIAQDPRLQKKVVIKIPDDLLFRAGARVDKLVDLLQKECGLCCP